VRFNNEVFKIAACFQFLKKSFDNTTMHSKCLGSWCMVFCKPFANEQNQNSILKRMRSKMRNRCHSFLARNSYSVRIVGGEF